jgi:DNA-binding GntR family transcriptional regulator
MTGIAVIAILVVSKAAWAVSARSVPCSIHQWVAGMLTDQLKRASNRYTNCRQYMPAGVAMVRLHERRLIESAAMLPGQPGDPAPEEVDPDAILTDRLRSSILAGALPPGTKLPEEVLAQGLDITRARVRAILQRLAFEELVELKRNRGAFIASPTPKEAADMFEARRVIERVTTEIVTRTILTRQIGVLRRHLARQDTAWQQGDFHLAIRALGEFHLALCALARNGALTGALERLIRRTSLTLSLYAPPRGAMRVMRHYRELMDVMAARLMERCLFALERELDMRHVRQASYDIRLAIAAMA